MRDEVSPVVTPENWLAKQQPKVEYFVLHEFHLYWQRFRHVRPTQPYAILFCVKVLNKSIQLFATTLNERIHPVLSQLKHN